MDTVLKCNTSCNRGLSAWEGVQGRNSRATPQVNCCVGLSVSTREPPGLLPIARAGMQLGPADSHDERQDLGDSLRLG